MKKHNDNKAKLIAIKNQLKVSLLFSRTIKEYEKYEKQYIAINKKLINIIRKES